MKSIRLTSPLVLVAAAAAVAITAIACSSDDDDNGSPTPDAGVYIDGGIMQGAPPGPTGYGEGDSGTFSGPPDEDGSSDYDSSTTDATSPIMLGDGGDDDDDDAGDDGGDAATDAGDAGDAEADASDAGDAGDAGDADAGKK